MFQYIDTEFYTKKYHEFAKACAYGELSLAKEILLKIPKSKLDKLDISQNNYQVFRNTCKNGHLEVAQWLLTVNPNINNISANNENTFCFVCLGGHLEVAKWLLTVKPDIDISINNEEVFRYTCEHGNLEVAQWLLTVKPDIDISVLDEWAFCNACYNGSSEVALWLQTLKPYLYVINYIRDGRIDYYIRTKEEAKWEKIKNGLWLQSVNCENINIINTLPIDISKTVLLYC